MRNLSEISSMVARLEQSKSNFPQFNFFGDDNWKAIDVAIDTLENQWSSEDVEDQNYDLEREYHVYDLALKAVDWLDGEIEDEELLGDD